MLNPTCELSPPGRQTCKWIHDSIPQPYRWLSTLQFSHCCPRHGGAPCAVWIPGCRVDEHDKMVIILHRKFGVVYCTEVGFWYRSPTFKSKFFLSGDESWVSYPEVRVGWGQVRAGYEITSFSASIHRQSILAHAVSPGNLLEVEPSPEPQSSWQLLPVSSSQDQALLSPKFCLIPASFWTVFNWATVQGLVLALEHHNI